MTRRDVLEAKLAVLNQLLELVPAVEQVHISPLSSTIPPWVVTSKGRKHRVKRKKAKRVLSEAGWRAISRAQKARWAKMRGAAA